MSIWGTPWHPGVTELGWRLATEPVGAVDLGPGIDTAMGSVAEARTALAWWVEHGEMWLTESPDGLSELPIPHWIASRTPVEEPASALADPNVQLAVSTRETRCARCGTDISIGQTFGLVRVPNGPAGWCCEPCVIG